MRGDDAKPRFSHSPQIWFGVGLLVAGAINRLALDDFIRWDDPPASLMVLSQQFLEGAIVAGVIGTIYLVSAGIGLVGAGVDKVVKQRKAERDFAAQC